MQIVCLAPPVSAGKPQLSGSPFALRRHSGNRLGSDPPLTIQERGEGEEAYSMLMAGLGAGYGEEATEENDIFGHNLCLFYLK